MVISNPWISWFKAASLPAFVSLLATPLVLYNIYAPETKDTPDAPAMAAKRLEQMGPVTKNEWVMVGTMLLAVSLWVFGYVQYGFRNITVEFFLILLKELKWLNCVAKLLCTL